MGAYGKDWLWEQSVEKSVLGVGAQRRDWLPLPKKTMKNHLGLDPLKNKSFKLLRKGSKSCFPFIPISGKGEDLLQLVGKKKE